MYGKVISSCLYGVEGRIVETEVDIQRGLPCFHIVGLPDSAVKESIERVRAALKNNGFEFPLQRITINLAPATLRKEGTSFDLAIACGILLANGQWKQNIEKTLIVGELALDGSVRRIAGILPMIEAAKQYGIEQVILPHENRIEASRLSDIKLLPVKKLNELKHPLEFEFNDINISRDELSESDSSVIDLSSIRGQFHAKRALSIACAGMHNIVFIGPPGSGKTMLMKGITGLLPRMTESESLQVNKIYSAARLLDSNKPSICKRPFRAPHHSVTSAGMLGGGAYPVPGEISLAHLGVLFLDELPEFSRSVLESLRQPIEEGEILISRVKSTYRFPSRFMLAAAMNPCPCGHLGSETENQICQCTIKQIQRYRSKISGPLADRIDLQVEVPRVPYEMLSSNDSEVQAKSLNHLQQLVHNAQAIQRNRYKQEHFQYNSELSSNQIHQYCIMSSDAENILKQSYEKFELSGRAFHRLLKIARTIADLESSEQIEVGHVAEALQYRALDKKMN